MQRAECLSLYLQRLEIQLLRFGKFAAVVEQERDVVKPDRDGRVRLHHVQPNVRQLPELLKFQELSEITA